MGLDEEALEEDEVAVLLVLDVDEAPGILPPADGLAANLDKRRKRLLID